MAENTLTCTLCGGTDFTKEAGYYYCNECQTQSQEVQEHVFEQEYTEEPTISNRRHTKRIRSQKKEEDQLTSWECYNYIILGLVNELIENGAKDTLKDIVRILWFKYLHKLEVLSDKPDGIPKLGACNSKIDAEIIYGKPAKKKRTRSRTPSPSASESTHDSTSLRRQRSKTKRSLILAKYDEYSFQLQSEEVSLHNQSLSSLGAISGSSSEKTRRLQFNKAAKAELLKSMSKNHYKQHCQDSSSLLGCHNFSYRKLSEKYTKGPQILTRKKMYALIYLGLLINKEKIQLGDMLRFIREGHVSYHTVDHFFPEEYENRNLNIKSWGSHSGLLTHKGIRVIAAKIAKFIGVVKYIPKQNLIELCQRYCSELNLPDEAWGFTLNLMSRIPPRMRFINHSNAIPNYEGRALSMILFTVKLIFGLDDCTEEHFSNYAESINGLGIEKMFNWRDWAHYIIYRKLVLMQHHFPTQHFYNDDNVQSCNEFVTFITEQNLKYNRESINSSHIAEVLKGLLQKLKEKQGDTSNELRFISTLKPFRDYIEVLLDSSIPDENSYLIEVLESNFEKDSFGFLTNPYLYLEHIHQSKRVGIKHRGANKNLTMIKIQNIKRKRENWRIHANQKQFVSITKEANKAKALNIQQVDNELDTKTILKKFEIHNMPSYKQRMSQMARIYNRSKNNLEHNIQKLMGEKSKQTHTNGLLNDSLPFIPISATSATDHRHCIHYNPHDRFWLRSQNVSEINKKDFMAFFCNFPESFKLIFSECARISEQDLKEYFEEYTNVEIYLCYASSFTKIGQQEKVDIELNKLIKIAIRKW